MIERPGGLPRPGAFGASARRPVVRAPRRHTARLASAALPLPDRVRSWHLLDPLPTDPPPEPAPVTALAGMLTAMSRRRALWLLGATTLALFVVLSLLDMRMQDEGGHGIVAFELAGSLERAQEIRNDWGEAGRDAAAWSLWIDYAYLISYAAFGLLALLAIRDGAQRRGLRRLARAGGAIAWLPVAAAALDAVEDAFLLLALGGHGGEAAPLLGTVFATLKFACLAVAIVYLLAGLVAFIARRSGADDARSPAT